MVNTLRRRYLKASILAGALMAVGSGAYFLGFHGPSNAQEKESSEQYPTSKASYIIMPENGAYKVYNTLIHSSEYSSSDAGLAIQYAVDKLSSGNGGNVVLKSGKYNVSTTVMLKSHVNLIGENGATLAINTGGDGIVIAEDSSFVEVKGITIYGQGPIVPGALIRILKHAYRVTLTDIEAYNYYNGIVIEGAYPPNDNWGIFISRVHISNSYHDGLAILGYGNVYFIQDTVIAESGNNCITLENTADGVMAFENIHCFDSSNFSVHAYNTDGRLVQHKRFIAVNFEGLSQHPKSVRFENCMNIALIDCETAGMWNNGVEFINCSDSKVIGNRIINNSLGMPGNYAGVYIENSQGIIVANSSIYDTNPQQSKMQGYGIMESGSSDYNIYMGNIMRGNAVSPYKIIGTNDIVTNNIT